MKEHDCGSNLIILADVRRRQHRLHAETVAQSWALAKELLIRPRWWGWKVPPASVRAYRYMQAWRVLCGAPCTMTDMDLWRLVLDAQAYLKSAGRWGCVLSFHKAAA